MAEASTEFRVCRHFLLSSPPGEVKEVLKDCKALAPSVLSEQAVNPVLFQYHEERLTPVNLPDDRKHKGLMCKELRVAPGTYYDPIGHLTFTVDPVAESCTVEAASEAVTSQFALSESHEAIRSSLQQELSVYLEGQFCPLSLGSQSRCDSVKAAVATVVSTEEGDALTVLLSARNVHLPNWWSGSWRSQWSVVLGNSSATLRGSTSVDVHYFEESNVQMNQRRDFNVALTLPQGADDLAKLVVSEIGKCESEMQNHLESLYSSLTDTLKAIRRALPVTQEKMNWNLNRHRVAESLSSKQ
eukprot:GILI01004329.1.p1 GENE.GILI01004329.1~~GILI01004329.1.p1  ORF type:complete len:315 (+),score=110.87 GILI01004329.1:47-946(+)